MDGDVRAFDKVLFASAGDMHKSRWVRDFPLLQRGNEGDFSKG
jgi:hypothetical protein